MTSDWLCLIKQNEIAVLILTCDILHWSRLIYERLDRRIRNFLQVQNLLRVHFVHHLKQTALPRSLASFFASSGVQWRLSTHSVLCEGCDVWWSSTLVGHGLISVEFDGVESYFPTKSSSLWLLNLYYKFTWTVSEGKVIEPCWYINEIQL